MSVSGRDRADILLYLGLATLLSGVWEAAIVGTGHLGGGFGFYAMALMWSPGVAALLTCRWRGIALAELGWRWPATRWILAGWLVPFGYCVAAYGVIWASGLGSYGEMHFVKQVDEAFGLDVPSWTSTIVFVALAGTAGVVRSCISALGEEIGWRGFLVPRLARVTGPLGVVLVSGTVWTLYHVAVLVGADYNSGTPVWWGLSCFTVLVFSMSVVMAWVRLASNSLWPAVLIHGSHNLFVQQVFTPMTGDRGHTAWVVDEFGIAVPIAVLLLAIWVIASGRLARAHASHAVSAV
jgi:membrane protease YdiL (CAAX protease family)